MQLLKDGYWFEFSVLHLNLTLNGIIGLLAGERVTFAKINIQSNGISRVNFNNFHLIFLFVFTISMYEHENERKQNKLRF